MSAPRSSPDDAAALALGGAAQGLDAAQLAKAFAAFSQASEELSSAYNALQGQAEQLHEQLNVLMAALPAGVVLLDKNARITQQNRVAENLLGACSGKQWQAVAARLTPAQGGDEFICQAAAGERRLSISQTRLESGEGEVVLLHDITENHRMRQLAERNERLAAMGEMVAGLAHQLRTPLSAALLYTAHLRQPELAANERERVAGRALERLRYLERLIRDMLLFARGDSLGRQVFAVCELLTELGHTLEPLARARQINFSVHCGCEGMQIHADRKALGGALTNLLENAIQATDSGGRVRFEAVQIDAQKIEFSVCDSGKGMDVTQLERVFEPFFTTRAEGTGLGLAIARGVARGHGGDINAVSTPGEGSRFALSLSLQAVLADNEAGNPTERNEVR